jgi:hypothetical protein
VFFKLINVMWLSVGYKISLVNANRCMKQKHVYGRNYILVYIYIYKPIKSNFLSDCEIELYFFLFYQIWFEYFLIQPKITISYQFYCGSTYGFIQSCLLSMKSSFLRDHILQCDLPKITSSLNNSWQCGYAIK